MKLKLSEIVALTSGRMTPANATGVITGVSTDSRTIRPGELFVPLRGPNFDGHDFLIRALRNGAAACLSEEVIAGFQVPVIQVEDTLQALGEIARGIRRRFSGPVAAITGSSGKTTTKEMLAHILSLTGPGLKSQGNFNNLIGLPLTLFGLKEEHCWAVLEMGMSARGEISRLAEIGQPTVGLITNVGLAHLETLHGLDGVARAKGELFAALGPGCTAVINADDERVAAIPVANGVRRLLYGLSPAAEIRAENILAEPDKVRFKLLLPAGGFEVVLHVVGRFNVANALAAAAVATVLDVSAEQIVKGLEQFRPIAGRMQVALMENGTILIEDTYNANPISMEAALQALDEMNGGGRRIAVLGDMLELGAASAQLHRQLGNTAARRCDLLVLLGEQAEQVAEGAREGGLANDRIRLVDNHEQAVEFLTKIIAPQDRLLLKGSRGMRMERISAGLRRPPARDKAGNH
jgi:UDP-N-acetylmuramoyl-tripeptide--D-alanyl-D-alanine ligase